MTTLEYHRLRDSYVKARNLEDLENSARAQDPGFPERIRSLLPTPDEQLPRDAAEVELNAADRKLLSLCELFHAGSTEQRTFIQACINRSSGAMLLGFSFRMATLAARQKSERYARTALLAHAIEDLAAGDVRDNLCLLAVIADAARRVGTEPTVLFQEAAGIAAPAMAQVLLDYVKRAQWPSLGSMGFQAVETSAGTEYRQAAVKRPRPSKQQG